MEGSLTVERTTTHPARRVRPARPHAFALSALAWVALLVATAKPAAADPMRPLGGGSAPASTVQPAPGPAATPAAPAPAPRLLATRRDAAGAWQGLVGRQWLAVGDRLGPATVRDVRPDRLVLQHGARTETLHLLPPLTPFVSRFEPTPEPRTRSAAL